MILNLYVLAALTYSFILTNVSLDPWHKFHVLLLFLIKLNNSYCIVGIYCESFNAKFSISNALARI